MNALTWPKIRENRELPKSTLSGISMGVQEIEKVMGGVEVLVTDV